jgi:hypothetical protein
MSKTMHEVLAMDLKKNYPEGWMDEDEYVSEFYKLTEKFEIFRHGDTIFMVEHLPNNECEWHTKNAARGYDLADNFIFFLEELKSLGFKKATTYFDNEKIFGVTNLPKLADYGLIVTRVDNGQFRTWKLEVAL